MGCQVSVNGEEPVVCQMILPSFGTDCGNQEWSRGVPDNIRKSHVTVLVKQGRSRLEPGPGIR